MPDFVGSDQQSEVRFAELVDALSEDSVRHELLVDLLLENHSFDNERSAATISRMRGWVCLHSHEPACQIANFRSCSKNSLREVMHIWSPRQPEPCDPIRAQAPHSLPP